MTTIKSKGVIKFVATFITPKFYSRGSDEDQSDSVKEMVKMRVDREGKGPRELHRSPLLNSQR